MRNVYIFGPRIPLNKPYNEFGWVKTKGYTTVCKNYFQEVIKGITTKNSFKQQRGKSNLNFGIV